MNRNNDNEICLRQLSALMKYLKAERDVCKLLSEIMTTSELSVLSKRWRILRMLAEGKTQRDIARELNVSLCKVTRGAKILKDKNAIVTKYLIKKERNDDDK